MNTGKIQGHLKALTNEKRDGLKMVDFDSHRFRAHAAHQTHPVLVFLNNLWGLGTEKE
jgi:hypothetical protein